VSSREAILKQIRKVPAIPVAAAEMVACRMLTGLDELRELFSVGGGR
jgi:hypothetical protein